MQVTFKWFHSLFYLTVPLNYNFIFTRVETRGAMHAVFRVLIPKIAVEIYISTRRDVAFPRVVFSRDVEFTRVVVLHAMET